MQKLKQILIIINLKTIIINAEKFVERLDLK
jgi:hypothetical protein